MRSVYPLIIFIILVSSSALFGYRSFRQTQSCVQTELNQALNRTLTQRRGQIACTIRSVLVVVCRFILAQFPWLA